MRHNVAGKKLSRTKNERRLLFRNLVRELLDHGAIITTLTKAKAIQPMVDKLITKAKKQTEHDRRNIFSVVTDKVAVRKLMEDARLRFGARNSGYTRIVKLGKRRGDGTTDVVLSFVDDKPVVGELIQSKPGKKLPEKPKQNKSQPRVNKVPKKK